MTKATSTIGVARHEIVVADFGDLEPLIAGAGIGRDRIVDLLEVRIGRGDLGVEILCRLVACFHDRRREAVQLGAAGQQLL